MSDAIDRIVEGAYEIADAEPIGWNVWACHKDGTRTLIMLAQTRQMAEAKLSILRRHMRHCLQRILEPAPAHIT